MEKEETPLKYKVVACVGATIGFFALALGATGIISWNIAAERDRKELERSYQNLSADVRIYDSNEDRMFDSRELENLINNYELEKK